MHYDYGKRGKGIEAFDLGELKKMTYTVENHPFEIIVDPYNAWKFKQGFSIPITDIVEDFVIFSDLSQGLKASNEDLMACFGTEDPTTIVEIVLRRGRLSLTQDDKELYLKDIRDDIVSYLVENVVNPKTKLPYSAEIIEKAILHNNLSLNLTEPISEQAMKVKTALEKYLPMKLEQVTYEFMVPPSDAARMYRFLYGIGDVLDEDWTVDGSLFMMLRFPSAKIAEVLASIADYSKGRVRSTLVERSE